MRNMNLNLFQFYEKNCCSSDFLKRNQIQMHYFIIIIKNFTVSTGCKHHGKMSRIVILMKSMYFIFLNFMRKSEIYIYYEFLFFLNTVETITVQLRLIFLENKEKKWGLLNVLVVVNCKNLIYCTVILICV